MSLEPPPQWGTERLVSVRAEEQGLPCEGESYPRVGYLSWGHRSRVGDCSQGNDAAIQFIDRPNTQPEQRTYYQCGRSNHLPMDCQFKDASCHTYGKNGYLVAQRGKKWQEECLRNFQRKYRKTKWVQVEPDHRPGGTWICHVQGWRYGLHSLSLYRPLTTILGPKMGIPPLAAMTTRLSSSQLVHMWNCECGWTVTATSELEWSDWTSPGAEHLPTFNRFTLPLCNWRQQPHNSLCVCFFIGNPVARCACFLCVWLFIGHLIYGSLRLCMFIGHPASLCASLIWIIYPTFQSPSRQL